MSFLLGLIPVIGGAIGAGTFVGGVIDAAVVAGLSAASSSLFSKAKVSNGGGGIETTLSLDPDRPQTLVLGRAVVGGQLDFAATWGHYGRNENYHENVLLGMAIRLADHPIEVIERVWVNGEIITYRGTTGNGDVSLMSGDLLSYRFYSGWQNAADPVLVDGAQQSGHNAWPTTAIGRSTAYVRPWAMYQKTRMNKIPTFKWGIQGAACYDPRFDSTVSGNGPMRWGSLGTYRISRNPIVQAYNVARGIKVAASSGALLHHYGLEDSDTDIWPLDNFYAAANECDRIITTGDGRQIPQYTAGGEITVDTPPYDAMEALVATAGGRLADLGGRFVAILPSMLSTPVAIITDADVLASRELTTDLLAEDDERVNTVAATYLNWETGEKGDAPLYENTTLIAQDGGRRSKPLDTTLVDELDQVQRLQSQAALESRRQRRLALSLAARWIWLRAGHVIAWYSEERGFDYKLFSVEGSNEEQNYDSTLTIQEVDPNHYYPPTAGMIRPRSDAVFIPVSAIVRDAVDFAVAPFPWHGDNGRTAPAILATWVNPDDAEIAYFQIRRASDPSVVMRQQADITGAGVAASVILVGGLTRNTAYQVQMRLAGSGIGDGAWSLWRDVIAPDVGDVDLQDLGADVRAYLVTVDQLGDATVADARNQVAAAQANAAAIVEAQLGRVLDQISAERAAAAAREEGVRRVDSLRTEIDAATGAVAAALEQRLEAVKGGSTSSIAQVQTALAAGDAALASQIENVQSSVGTSIAGILRTQQSLTTETGALADQLDGLTASLGDTNAAATREQLARVGSEASLTALIEARARDYATRLPAIGDALSLLATAVQESGERAARSRLSDTLRAEAAAIAEIVESLSVHLDQTDASIVDVQTVLAAADTAIAQRVTTIEAQVGSTGTSASLTDLAVAQAGTNESVATRLTTAESRLGSAETAITDERNARVSADGAQATLITNAQATANQATATGRLQFDVIAGPTGAQSRIRLLARALAQLGGALQQAGLLVDTDNGGRIVLEAARTIIMSSAGTVAALFDSSGKLAKAYIPTIEANMITTGQLIASSAQIGDLVVGTSNINNSAVIETSTANNSVYVTPSTPTLLNLVVANPEGFPCLIGWQLIGSFGSIPVDGRSVDIYVDGYLFDSYFGPGGAQTSNVFPLGRYGTTFTISARLRPGTGYYNGSISLFCLRLKR
ncbi:hypothetical protein [Segnochrobactrum spirostomi]|uniref:DUF1983 domain-containing protein n=1 Tax=Segnochrobactrum spirostomi TaxID=2608987 RepID=A0A6A7Y3E5_9HYPH|nr:hypothetical protein [Segnochrobactrum spirostomi]MQT13634.1 hypothetical protein [Segnochrobactrum spirostomi]